MLERSNILHTGRTEITEDALNVELNNQHN